MTENNEIKQIPVTGRAIARLFLFVLLFFLLALGMSITPKSNNFPNNVTGFWRFYRSLRGQLGTVTLFQSIAVCLLGFLLFKEVFNAKRVHITALVVGFIFSVFTILGLSFSYFHDFSFIVHGKCQFAISFICFMAYWLAYYLLLHCYYDYLDNYKKRIALIPNKFTSWLAKHFFIASFAAMALFWLLFMIPYFPMSSPPDGREQIIEFYGVKNFSMHHPILGSYIMGFLYNFGYTIGGVQVACIFYLFVQVCFGAFVFSKISEYVHKMSGSLAAGLVTTFYFCFLPEWWAYMNAIIKDTMFFTMFALFTLECIKISFDKNITKKDFIKKLIAIVVVGFLCCEIRGDGIYRVAPTLFLMIFLQKDKRQKIMMLTACLVLTVSGITTTKLLDKYNHPEGRANQDLIEYRRLQIQTLARYVKTYGNEITVEEKNTIDKIMVYDKLAETYDPENSDPINRIHRSPAKNISKEDWKNFNKLWFSFFKKHPVCYAEAFFSNCYSFLYPYHWRGASNVLYIKYPINNRDKNVVLAKYIFPESLRRVAREAFFLFQKIPLLGFLETTGFYTWAGIILVAGLIRKKKFKYLIFFYAPFINVCICCYAAIINSYIRYVLPVMASMPLYVLLGILPLLKEDAFENKFEETVEEAAQEAVEGPLENAVEDKSKEALEGFPEGAEE